MKYCAACGLLPNDEGWFCPKCGKFVMQESALPAQEQIHTKADTIQSSLKTAAQLLTNTSTASSTSGEINFPIPLRNPDGLISAMGPFQCLLGGIINIFRGYRSALKDKKKWIPVTIMALLWLTMTLLPTMGVDVTSLKWLSWLTFANGGTTGSITAAVGGIIGKGLFAYLVTTVSISLGTRKNPFKGIWRIVKSIGGSLSLKNKSSVALLLCGLGTALIANNFMMGTNSLQLSMVSVTSLLVVLRSISSRASFMRQFVSSLITKKGKPIDATSVTRVMSGFALGFAISIGLSTIPFAYIGYLAGGFLLIAAIVLGIAGMSKKEVDVKC